MAYSTASDASKKAFEAEQSALARVGIKITGAPNDGSTYYSTFIGSPSNVKNQGFGISINGWGADFPTRLRLLPVDRQQQLDRPDTGNSNYPSLKDATVDGVLNGSLTGKSTACRLGEAGRRGHGQCGVPADLLRPEPLLPQPASDEHHE